MRILSNEVRRAGVPWSATPPSQVHPGMNGEYVEWPERRFTGAYHVVRGCSTVAIVFCEWVLRT